MQSHRFVVNAGVNVITNNFDILIQERCFCRKYLLYLTQVLLDIYREYVQQM